VAVDVGAEEVVAELDDARDEGKGVPDDADALADAGEGGGGRQPLYGHGRLRMG
jgi:hypothetical protein